MTLFPDVQVEIAFDSGWSTPAASRTWTDVSAYVELAEGIGIGGGRGDEFSVADANTLSLVLDNRDGRFTPGNTGSPYSPNVKVGRPIRVTATPDGEAEGDRFVGYIDAWPVSWDGTDAYAKVTITASSRISRLGSARQLRSVVEQETLLGSPALLYTLSEPEGSLTAYDSSGNSGDPLRVRAGRVPPVFGSAIGPGTDGLSAATFDLVSMDVETTATYHSLHAFVVTSGGPVSDMNVISDDADFADTFSLVVSATGTALAVIGGTFDIEGTTVVTDGLLHHLAVTHDPADDAVALYVDGVEEAAGTATPGSSRTLVHVGSNFEGTIAHAALHAGTLDTAQVAAIAQAGLDGFEGDTAAERLVRYASYAQVAAAEVDADTGAPPMAHADTTGQTVLDMMRKVEVTEGGVLFDAPDGTLTFRGRARRYQAASEFTFEAGAQEIEADYSPTFDLANLTNTVTASLSDGSVSVIALDQDSVDEYGSRSADVELITTDVDEPHARAWWTVGNYAEPAPRVPSLSVNLLGFSAADQTTILGLTVGSRITVTGLPAQAANDSEDYFVEGYTESISPSGYVLTFNVSPAAPYLTTWVLDSATRSQLGTTTRLAY